MFPSSSAARTVVINDLEVDRSCSLLRPRARTRTNISLKRATGVSSTLQLHTLVNSGRGLTLSATYIPGRR